MPDRRDDLDSWLDGRIDPLPPPPGTFELIKKRARHRKYRKLAVGAGAAAVVVAAAVAVPQMVNLPVLNPPTAAPAANGRSAAPTPSASRGADTASSASSEALPPSAFPPVPAKFRPSSVTFIGTMTGFVIGQAGTPGHCATRYCTSVARTLNAGRTWTGLPAPVTGPADGATGVSQIRFLNGPDGWAFGPQLYATHDAGHSWTQVDTDGLRVTDLETVGDRAFALFASCTGTGAAFATGCTSYTLYSSPASVDNWTPVGAATSGLSGGAASMVLTGTRGYLLAPDGMIFSGPVDGPVNGGAPWHPVKAIPCPVGQPLAGGQPTGALLAAGSAAHLIVVCASSTAPGTQQAKHVFTSADGGISWQNAGAAPSLGLATSVTTTLDGTIVLATGEGIDVRPAGSTTWQAATLNGLAPAKGFGYVGMTTDAQGIALPANPAVGTVWFTFDGGQTWTPSKVSR
ncbi:MAG TPA: sialidase family protein [Streptosporangiaceae bacterium]|nr:sialidase family protein [Streptosporangiaceae bacterium]